LSTFSDIWRSSSWTLSAGLYKLAIQLLVFILIGRLIETESLGHYFLSASLIFLPLSISEYSFTSSIIFQKEITQIDRQAVYGLNLVFYLIAAIIGLVTCYFLSSYYNYPRMLEYFLFLSPIYILIAFNNVQLSQLRREEKFKTFSLLDIIGTTALAAATIVLLWRTFGVYAIVIGLYAKQLLIFIILLSKNDLREIVPHWSRKTTGKHWEYGRFILGEKSFGQLLGYADSFIVNHFFGAAMLGIYEIFKRIIYRPLLVAYESLEQVFFPLLNKKENEKLEVKYKSFLRMTMLFVTCAFAFIFLAHFVTSALGEEYSRQEPILFLLILCATSLIILGPVDIMAYSENMNRKFMNWSIVFGVVQLIGMVVSAYFHISIMLLFIAAANIISYFGFYFLFPFIRESIQLFQWSKPVIFWICNILIAAILVFFLPFTVGSLFIFIPVVSILYYLLFVKSTNLILV